MTTQDEILSIENALECVREDRIIWLVRPPVRVQKESPGLISVLGFFRQGGRVYSKISIMGELSFADVVTGTRFHADTGRCYSASARVLLIDEMTPTTYDDARRWQRGADSRANRSTRKSKALALDVLDD